MTRRTRWGRLAPILPALVLLLTPVMVPLASGVGPSAGVGLTLTSGGTVYAGVETVIANGSALRYAMDGYFGPLVAELPGTNASRAAILAEINSTEDNPLFAGLFGDRDGRVDATVDVARFQALILSEAKLIPVSAITGVLNASMDGQPPVSDQLQGITFSNAPGPDNSSAPIGVDATLAALFSWSGVGAAHTFTVAWNLPSILGNVTVAAQPVNISFATPTAITITSVSGITNAQLRNDPFGWGAASVSGEYLPLPGHSIEIRFGPSFPTGDVIIGVVIAAVVAVAIVGLLLRRRRRRHATPVPAPGNSGVGPSSGSG